MESRVPVQAGYRFTLARLRRAARDPAAIYFLAAGISRAANFFLVPLYTRKLSPAEYGDYAFAQLIIAVLPIFLTCGLTAAVSRFYYDGADSEAGARRVGGIARWLVVITLVGTIVIQALVLTVGRRGQPGVGHAWELSCMLWAAEGGVIAGIPPIYLRARQSAMKAAAFQIGQFFAELLSSLILVGYLERGLRGAIEASAAAWTVQGCIGLGFVLVALRGSMTRQLLAEGLRFSLPFVPHRAGLHVMQTAERWVLKAVGMTSALGVYGLAVQVLAPATMAISAWNDANIPQMGESYRSGGIPRLRKEFRRTAASYLLVSAVPIAVMLGLLPVVSWIVGDRFAGVIWQVPLLAGCLLLESLYYPAVNILFFTNRTGTIPAVTITAGAINLGLSVVLIPRIGIGGAILSRAVASLGRTLAMMVAARVALRAESPSSLS